MDVTAKLTLWESDRRFRLPGHGTRSMLVRFGDGPSATSFGVWAADEAGEDFAPGTTHETVRLNIWADAEARMIVEGEAQFVVWYGGDIGRGEVTSIP